MRLGKLEVAVKRRSTYQAEFCSFRSPELAQTQCRDILQELKYTGKMNNPCSMSLCHRQWFSTFLSPRTPLTAPKATADSFVWPIKFFDHWEIIRYVSTYVVSADPGWEPLV